MFSRSLLILQNCDFMLLNPNSFRLKILSGFKKPNKLFGAFGKSYSRVVEKLAEKSVDWRWNNVEKVVDRDGGMFSNLGAVVNKWGIGGIWWNDLHRFCTRNLPLFNSWISTISTLLIITITNNIELKKNKVRVLFKRKEFLWS